MKGDGDMDEEDDAQDEGVAEDDEGNDAVVRVLSCLLM